MIVQASMLSPAAAQEAGDEAEGEEIVVTGSLLRRQVSEQSQLVTTLDEDDLERTGAGNAPQALATIAQNQVAISSSTSIGSGTGFASFANLRSLGSANTLVLFNSKRIVNNPYQTLGVDLNTIPVAMLERVETLSDGASSVYGSDAIAGVINFIPRREYDGFSISLSGFQPQEEGGERLLGSIAGGFGSLSEDGWNVYAGYTYHDKQAIAMLDRDFAATTYIPERGFNRLQNAPIIANWSQGPAQGGAVTTLQNPLAPACLPPSSPYANGFIGVNACAFDFAAHADAALEETDQSFYGRASARFAGNHYVWLEYLWGQTDLTSAISPLNLSGSVMSPASPYYPGNIEGPPAAPGLNPANNITLNWRAGVLGPFTVNPVTTTDRIVLQVEGGLIGWDYEAWALRSTSTVDLNFVNGVVNFTAFRNGLTGAGGAPFINPFGPQSATAAQYLEDIEILGTMQTAESTLDSAGVQLSRDLFDLPAGPVRFALAGEYKEEETSFRNAPELALAVGTGLNTARDIDGSRDAASIVGEVLLPITRGVDVDLSLRYDNYSDFGETTNPKVLITWAPAESLQFHASYNEGFRAPTLHNLFSPQTTPISNQRISDPVLCPGGTANVALGGSQARDCSPATHQSLQGGNADLQPEISSAYSLGVLMRPHETLSVGMDYWNYEISDRIERLSEAAIYANPAQYGALIVRCDAADPVLAAGVTNCLNPWTGPVAPIAYVVQTNQNLGGANTSGIDFTAHWEGPDTRLGRVFIDYRSTVVLEYEFQREPNGVWLDRLGRYQDGAPVIDYSHYVTFALESGPLTLQLSNRFLNGYDDCNAECGIAPAFHQHVDNYSLWDFAATWRAPAGATVTGRITNLFDTDPPFSNKTQGLSTGWDERFVDPTGRAFSLTLRYDFD
jgi:iron complex outermembrane receptor protein